MITFASVALTMAVGLVLMQYAHGITEEQRQANREKQANLIEEDIKNRNLSSTHISPQPCVIYQSPALIVINLNCVDGNQNQVISKYISQGYEIKEAIDKTMYLTKVK